MMVEHKTITIIPRCVFITLMFVLALLAAGCGGGSKPNARDGFKMASIDDMPAEVKAAPVIVQEAYQFAAANPDVMTHIPCYCGCGDMGHASNYSCYVSEKKEDGTLVYDNHALGCSICVDITQDAMRLLEQGKTVPEIRQYVDATYAKFGPSNMP